jgi:peptide/nickel transport system substrate-binding protein
VQSTGIFTPQMWFFDPSLKPLPYDPQAAGKLLDEAGWKPGSDGIRVKDGKRFSFTLLANNGNEVRRDIATLVQDDLKQIGIEVKVEIYEWAVLLKRFVNKGEFDAIVLGWGLGYDFDQYSIWHSSQTHPEELNFVGFSDLKVDRLLTDLRQEYARPEIIRIAGQLQSTIYKQQPYLFLFVPEGTEVMWKGAYRLRHPGPDGTWVDEPVHMTKAGWSYDMEWFYRPEYPPGPKR